MIYQKKDSISEVVKDLEIVLESTKEPSSHTRLKNAIETLKNKAHTLHVGEEQITIFSNEVVEFKPYDEYSSPVTALEKEHEKKYIDTKTVADYYGVTSETVRNWIKQKIISGHQVGPRGRYMIPREEFDYLKSRREQDKTEDIMKELLGDDYTDNWEIEIEE